jgi:hypothetical protein
MGCGSYRHFNFKSRIQVKRDSIFNDREQQDEMRRREDKFHRIAERHSLLAAERPN